jgi:arylsulfatase A-like enzyme
MVDQLSAKWLEEASKGTCAIPNIDKLLRNGVNFTNAFTSNPVCCPARATIATGLTTRGHGVLENGYQLDPSIPTFMQILQKSGWQTGAFGKVHFKPHFAGLYPNYRNYGFDVTHITEDPRGGEWLDWVEKEYPECYEAALATIWPWKIPEFANYGPRGIDLKSKIIEVRSKFQWATLDFPKNTWRAYTLPFPEKVSQTSWITRHALSFVHKIPSTKPFFTQISYVQPHAPSCPPSEYMKYVNVDKISSPIPPEWIEDPNAPSYFEGKKPVSEDWIYSKKCYFADVSHLDHQLGCIIDALEDTGRITETYIFFLSDHGDLLFDHGFCGKEERHYDACIRIPLIISGPGLQKGITCNELVQLEDILPTILDMTSLNPPPLPTLGPYLQVPSKNIPVLPGRSLLNLCRGENQLDWRDAAYCESYNTIGYVSPGDWARTIRTKEFRYTFYANGRGEQMFDIKNDKDEQNNVVADSKHIVIRHELRDKLLELIVMQDYPKTRRELFALGVH